jgi:threonine dehydratase
MEPLEQMNVDNVVASVGGGGLLSGIVSCYRVKGDTQTKYRTTTTARYHHLHHHRSIVRHNP